MPNHIIEEIHITKTHLITEPNNYHKRRFYSKIAGALESTPLSVVIIVPSMQLCAITRERWENKVWSWIPIEIVYSYARSKSEP